MIRHSGLDYTIFRVGMIYGRGDHLFDHLSRTVQTLPAFATVGFREKPIRPIPIDDLTDILETAVDGRMPRAPPLPGTKGAAVNATAAPMSV